MKHLKLLGVAVAAVCAFGMTMVSSAFAELPDVSLTLCTAQACYPLHLEVTLLTVKTFLSNGSSESLIGEGLLLLFLTSTLSSLGTFEALFTHVKENNATANECQSEFESKKDPLGEVLTKGTYHLVFTSLAGSAQGLKLGVLYLVQEVTISCTAEKIHVKGNTISSLSLPGTNGAEELTELGGQLLGTLNAAGERVGKPELTNYYNDAETGVKPKLEANFGSGFASAAEEIETGLVVTHVLKTNMFTISPR